MSTASYAHIEVRPDGVPIVAGTRIKVSQIAVDQTVHGWNVAEIQLQHPVLTLGQIHSALAYYYDHQVEMDRTMDEADASAERLLETLVDPAVQDRLRQAKQRAQSP